MNEPAAARNANGAAGAADEGPSKKVLVCHGGTCRAHGGGEALLTEIEELMSTVGDTSCCTASRSDCLQSCSEGPVVVVRVYTGKQLEGERKYTRINSLKASAKVVEQATGKRPALENVADRRKAKRRASSAAGSPSNRKGSRRVSWLPRHAPRIPDPTLRARRE